MKCFGNPAIFALKLDFIADPDQGQGASLAHSLSWGSFSIWSHETNLCDYRASNRTCDQVAWYLLPLLGWLVRSWGPLLHEERLPVAGDSGSARQAYWSAQHRVLGDNDPQALKRAGDWHAWWMRHALRATREGGIFPDVFMRRVQDYIEISWGNQELPGAPEGCFFTAHPGVRYHPVAEVANVLCSALDWASSMLTEQSDLPEFRALADGVRRLDQCSSEEWLRWFVPGSEVRRALQDWEQRVTGKVATLFVDVRAERYLAHYAPATLMFGAASPEIGMHDVETLLQALTTTSHGSAGDSSLLGELAQALPLSATREAYDEGYELAIELLEGLGLPQPADAAVNIEEVINRLGIAIQDVVLDDRTVRGVAIAGDDLTPTVLVNPRHPMNRASSGRRFTLAHELCHILYDRGYGQRLALISGPWAPPGVEQRANAFAAMLLMPCELVNRHCARLDGPPVRPDDIRMLAQAMQTGFYATLEHLCNLGRIDQADKEAIRTEALNESELSSGSVTTA